MTDYVWLELKRNRGWPWPEESYGLTPMFGEDGWCGSCGVPQRAQCGELVLQRTGMKSVSGAWMPNWIFDVVCLERSLADAVAEAFALEMLDVHWRGAAPGLASQIVIPTVGRAWYDQDKLACAAIEHHGRTGATCPECGTWRWLPVVYEELPPLLVDLDLDGRAIAASPEWFGDGMKAFRSVLVLRELAEMISAASPRDFKVVPVSA